MGSYLQKPVVQKESYEGTGQGYKWGSTAMQGWRTNMEDSHIHQGNLGNLQTFGLFIVFDGHSGAQYANQVAKEFPSFLAGQEPFSTLKDGDDYDTEQIKAALRESFLKYDKQMQTVPNISTSGCTATGVLVTPKHFFMMNIGDSRSVVCRKNAFFFATEDHKPTHYSERMRIEKAGGHVSQNRVNGQLAVSRALGDFEMKRNNACDQISQLVSPEADVTVLERIEETDNFITICCDGIFDVMSNEEVVDYFKKRIPYKRHLKDLCEDLADYCCHKGSKDNLSVMILNFDASNIQPEDDKISHDEELDNRIRELTQEYVNEAFADGKSAYGWEPCFNKLNTLHKEAVFDKPENTQELGIALKKGVIFAEFDKLAMAFRDTRRAEALRRMEEDRNQNQ